MTAAKLNICWEDDYQAVIPARSARIETEESRNQLTYTRQITRDHQGLRCPHCEAIIYSRRSKLCGVCGESLPKQFHFSPDEAQRIEDLIRCERERFRRWRERSNSL